MVCPYCGEEMESGVLQGGGNHGVGWREKPSMFPNLLNVEWLGTSNFKYSYIPAHRCTKCRKIILDY